MSSATADESVFHDALKNIELQKAAKAVKPAGSEMLSEKFRRRIRSAVAAGDHLPKITQMYPLRGHSNDLVRVCLDDGRSLMVKRSRFDWAEPRFLSARRASELIRERGLAVVPEYIDLPILSGGMPVLAYWYIDLPTLGDLWPRMPEEDRPRVLQSLGSMLRRIHRIGVNGHGPLGQTGGGSRSSARYFSQDLRDRLKPAVWGKWSEAIPLLNRLEETATDLPAEETGAVLVHNDIHLGNILCDEVGGEIRCVGLLDLEAAGGGRPESDLASASVLHSPLFSEDGKGEWTDRFDEWVLEGYGDDPDPKVLQFFRAYHMLNLGFFSALNGDEWHAGRVARRTRQLMECA